MKKLILFIAVISICFSCKTEAVEGNKNLITVEREVSEDFNKITASTGLNVSLIQSEEYKISVSADENLQELIKTQVSNGRLKIYITNPIKNHSNISVDVYAPDIVEINTNSGARLQTKEVLKTDSLSVKSSSGSWTELEVNTLYLNSNSSSGANIKFTGKTESYRCVTSSGSHTNSANLISKKVNANSSSGSSAKVYCTDNLQANTSSGGNIQCSGAPINSNIHESSGGSIRIKKQ